VEKSPSGSAGIAAEKSENRKGMVTVLKETVVYEPPALVEAGDFEKVTLGPRGWGFEIDVRCLVWCD
jgi:hypothetical protein